MFYLMTLNMTLGKKNKGPPRLNGNALFNDALNTFYLWLYGVGHMVKDHSDSERGNPLLPLAARVLLYALSQSG